MTNDEQIFMIRQWGENVGITGEGGKGTVPRQYRKLLEEVGELGEALMTDDTVETIDAIGDCAVVLVLLAQLKGLRFEDCLQSAYEVISKRRGAMVGGAFVKDEGHENCHSGSHCGCLHDAPYII